MFSRALTTFLLGALLALPLTAYVAATPSRAIRRRHARVRCGSAAAQARKRPRDTIGPYECVLETRATRRPSACGLVTSRSLGALARRERSRNA